jgi:hypothetical protein
MTNFEAYKGDPDEFARFSINNILFTVVTAPADSIHEEAEIIPTFDKERVLIALSQEQVKKSFSDDMPDLVRGIVIGRLVGACMALAERWLKNGGNTDGSE